MEPIIYKPSIYKGTGIYKIGAEGASGQLGSFPFKTDLTNYANGVDQPQIGYKYFIRNYEQYNITDDNIIYDGLSYNGKNVKLKDTSINPTYSLSISGCEKKDLSCDFFSKFIVAGTRLDTICIIWVSNSVGIAADLSSQNLQFLVNSSYSKSVYNSTYRRSDTFDWYYIDNSDISGFKIKFKLDVGTNKMTLYVNDLKRLETDFIDDYFYGIQISPRFETSVSIANIQWQ